MKLDVQTTPTIVSFTGWFIILPECFVRKDKIQTFVDIGVLTLKSEQKKITANMMTLNFGTFPKVIIQDRVAFTPEVRMEVINPLAK